MIDRSQAEQPRPASAEVLVGRKLRDLRSRQGLSLRSLADLSGLNVNTLSLIENGKTSPSVSTLHQLALALKVPIAIFFESEPVEQRIVFTPASQRPSAEFGSIQMQNLGKNLLGNLVQPFAVSLKPGTGSGEHMVVHTGHEFIYCLAGSLRCRVDEKEFNLKPGDSLVFEAHLPHHWDNPTPETTEFILVLYPADTRDEHGGWHFSAQTLRMEINMKIAVITDDGKSISQHFGRAPYYLVLTIEEGKIVQRELREKIGHNQFNAQHHEEHDQAGHHGAGGHSHSKHVSMAETIADCATLLCGGMGRGAYDSMRALNIQPVVTDIRDIDAAVESFIEGTLVDHIELLH